MKPQGVSTYVKQVEVNGVRETGEVRMRECEGANYQEQDNIVETDVKRFVGQSNAAWLREYGKRPSACLLKAETPSGSNEPDPGGFASCTDADAARLRKQRAEGGDSAAEVWRDKMSHNNIQGVP